MNREQYHRYLASREWAQLKEAVRKRARNLCERCSGAQMDAVHHLTYIRIGQERLEDLIAICSPCHEFTSGKSDIDPAKRTINNDEVESLINFGLEHDVPRSATRYYVCRAFGLSDIKELKLQNLMAAYQIVMEEAQ